MKGQPPVPAHRNGVGSLSVTFEWVQTPSGCVHVAGVTGVIQGGELESQFPSVLRLDAALGARPEESLQAFMSETRYHRNVKCRFTLVNSVTEKEWNLVRFLADPQSQKSVPRTVLNVVLNAAGNQVRNRSDCQTTCW